MREHDRGRELQINRHMVHGTEGMAYEILLTTGETTRQLEWAWKKFKCS